MSKKTSENVKPLDEFAEKVHGFVDRFQERVASMEKITPDCPAAIFSERALAKVERKMSQIESKMDKFQDYAEKNPMVASLIAFRIDALSTRPPRKRRTKVAKDASSKKSRKVRAREAA